MNSCGRIFWQDSYLHFPKLWPLWKSGRTKVIAVRKCKEILVKVPINYTEQWSPTLVLRAHCPACFRSFPTPTQLIQMIALLPLRASNLCRRLLIIHSFIPGVNEPKHKDTVVENLLEAAKDMRLRQRFTSQQNKEPNHTVRAIYYISLYLKSFDDFWQEVIIEIVCLNLHKSTLLYVGLSQNIPIKFITDLVVTGQNASWSSNTFAKHHTNCTDMIKKTWWNCLFVSVTTEFFGFFFLTKNPHRVSIQWSTLALVLHPTTLIFTKSHRADSWSQRPVISSRSRNTFWRWALLNFDAANS